MPMQHRSLIFGAIGVHFSMILTRVFLFWILLFLLVCMLLEAQMRDFVFSQCNTGKQCWFRVLQYMGQLTIYIKVDFKYNRFSLFI